MSIGGTAATPFSWPSQVLLVKTIDGFYVGKNGIQTRVYQQYICGGTLINSYTVVTANHCTSPTFSLDGDGEFSIQTNLRYPTIESIFTVYLGIYDKSFINYGGALPQNAVKRSVAKIIRVNIFWI